MFFQILFLLVGILLVVPAAFNILRNMRIKREGILVSATVVDIQRTRRASKNISHLQYHPVFEYLADGRPVKTRGPGNAEVKYPVGTVLDIRYDPQRPERILIGELVAKGYIAPILIGIALIIGSVMSMLDVDLPELGSSAGYIVFVVMLLLFVIIIISIVRSLRGAGHNIAERVLSGQTAGNVLVAAKNENSTITFQFVNGNQINYVVPESVYEDIRVGDWGNLTFQGFLFIQFERTYR